MKNPTIESRQPVKQDNLLSMSLRSIHFLIFHVLVRNISGNVVESNSEAWMAENPSHSSVWWAAYSIGKQHIYHLARY
jgi:uncharacterized protein (DUF2062 family)